MCGRIDMNPLPGRQKGTYLLILRLQKDRRIRIGKLGLQQLTAGFFGYVGSAFGPGGLRARLNHHLRTAARPRWHIDYLRKAAAVEQIWFSTEDRQQEHAWASLLKCMSGIDIPVDNFGATDCRCRSHLFRFVRKPSFVRFARALNREMPGIAPDRISRIRLTKPLALGNGEHLISKK